MTRTLLFVAALAVAGTARGEMLLFEATRWGYWGNGGIGEPVHVAYQSHSGGFPRATLVSIPIVVTDADIGTEFHADPLDLPQWQENFETQPGESQLTNTIGDAVRIDVLGCPSLACPDDISYVPRLGYGLIGYRLSDVTVTLDHLRYWQDGATYVEVTLTAKLYGDPILDWNENGTVDAADYVTARKLDLDPAWYDMWRAEFGASTQAALSVATIPEPTVWVLAHLGCGILYAFSQRMTSFRVRSVIEKHN